MDLVLIFVAALASIVALAILSSKMKLPTAIACVAMAAVGIAMTVVPCVMVMYECMYC